MFGAPPTAGLSGGGSSAGSAGGVGGADGASPVRPPDGGGGLGLLRPVAKIVRSDRLVGAIAENLSAGNTVILTDVNYEQPLYGEKESIRANVAAKVGDELAGKVINLDHHSAEKAKSTATEIVLENLDRIRAIDGKVVAITNHGDTDSLLSLFLIEQIHSELGDDTRQLFAQAARAGDHGEGDFTAAFEDMPPALRLSLAIEAICAEDNLFPIKLWRIKDDVLDTAIAKATDRALDLIGRARSSIAFLGLREVADLVEKNPTRMSYNLVNDAANGRDVEGVTIHRDDLIPPIVVVDVSVPGRDDFNPLPAYQTALKPAVILIKRNGRIVGIGRNNADADWLNLAGKEGRTSIYERFGMRLKGGAHAGGANVARDAFNTLPDEKDAVWIVRQFIIDSTGETPQDLI